MVYNQYLSYQFVVVVEEGMNDIPVFRFDSMVAMNPDRFYCEAMCGPPGPKISGVRFEAGWDSWIIIFKRLI